MWPELDSDSVLNTTESYYFTISVILQGEYRITFGRKTPEKYWNFIKKRALNHWNFTILGGFLIPENAKNAETSWVKLTFNNPERRRANFFKVACIHSYVLALLKNDSEWTVLKTELINQLITQSLLQTLGIFGRFVGRASKSKIGFILWWSLIIRKFLIFNLLLPFFIYILDLLFQC